MQGVDTDLGTVFDALVRKEDIQLAPNLYTKASFTLTKKWFSRW